jgi:hypothetical protein
MNFNRIYFAFLLFWGSNALVAQKTPDQFLPHAVGEQFTPHHMLTAYFAYLAEQSPKTMRLEQYGTTHEARPLKVAFFGSPENIARLEQIRLNNLRLAGMGDGQSANSAGAPAIVWLGMSVHGNEPSGAECSMTLAWQLATQTDPEVREWLRNTVVILDPSCNPDGYDRYTSWYRSASNLLATPHPASREHDEPWPGGRPNHYLHDLNRDWAWATQVETRQRLELYQRWLPHIHADLHEQYIEDPYYFAPAAEPMHAYITPWQRQFQTEIGQNHARYFNQYGWRYFSKEVFDLLYPSYGDTYPMLNGAIGMTYEQAGHSRAGRAILLRNHDTLKLSDRALHHLTTSRSTIEITSKNATRVVENFRDFYTRSASNPPGQYGAFCIRATNDPNRVWALCQLLDRHKIKYGKAGASLSTKAYDYLTNREMTASIQPNDLIISAYQPRGILAQVLLEPVPQLTDSLTYDITAWSLIHAYGLDAYALKQRLDPKQNFAPPTVAPIALAASPYAWCFHRRSLAESKCLAELLEAGVNVRYGREPFGLTDQQFAAGSVVITQADNRGLAGQLDGLVQAAAQRANVTLHPVFSGWAGQGPDLGSDKFSLMQRPEVAVVYGDDVSANSFGHTWYFFEQELGYPVVMLPLGGLRADMLRDFNTLIFPDGQYDLDEKKQKLLRDWVQAGGRLVAFEGGARAFAGKDGFDLKMKAEPKKDTATQQQVKPYVASERSRISDQVPGAVIATRTDLTNPLAYGLGEVYFTLKASADAFEMPTNGGAAAVWVGADYTNFGFIGSRVKGRLANTPVAVLQPMGDGEAIFFVDNPLFRSFWQQGKMLFSNALFH